MNQNATATEEDSSALDVVQEDFSVKSSVSFLLKKARCVPDRPGDVPGKMLLATFRLHQKPCVLAGLQLMDRTCKTLQDPTWL